MAQPGSFTVTTMVLSRPATLLETSCAYSTAGVFGSSTGWDEPANRFCRSPSPARKFNVYQRFVDIVDQGRPQLTRDQVQSLANGLIYSAKQAKANGLVDMLADADQAHEEMCRMMSEGGTWEMPSYSLVYRFYNSDKEIHLVSGEEPEIELKNFLAFGEIGWKVIDKRHLLN